MLIRIRRTNLIKYLYKLLFIIVGTLPKKSNVVVFESFLGKQYSCNPRAIYEKLTSDFPGFTCYWSVDPKYLSRFGEYDLNVLPRFSLRWLLVMARAKYWVSNSRLPLWVPKPYKTVYLQTWHGTPLKKLGVDIEEVHMPGTNTENYKKNFTSESNRWDYLISPNDYSTEIFTRAFRFKGEIIKSGYPRNDYLIHSSGDDVRKIKSSMGIPNNKKVILYAPTWRDNEYHKRGQYKFSLMLDLEKMHKELGQEYIILLRLHYLVADQVDLSDYEGFVVDASNHTDIRELYVISDLLLTDYSSVFFDYAILKRPMIFFVYDIENYRDNLRGFYFNFEEEAPGPLVKDTDEVIGTIKGITNTKLKSDRQKFNEYASRFVHLEDGNATSRVIEKVFK
nr:CDP-glycerol glycerophosphotransferase family protein [Alteribacter populi]